LPWADLDAFQTAQAFFRLFNVGMFMKEDFDLTEDPLRAGFDTFPASPT